jgi:hypothetical protein
VKSELEKNEHAQEQDRGYRVAIREVDSVGSRMMGYEKDVRQ